MIGSFNGLSLDKDYLLYVPYLLGGWSPTIASYVVLKNKRVAELEFDGKVYVLTDEDSFSSAMLFAEMVVDNGLGKVIGESPAESCNSCGEITQFYFDDVGTWLSVSTAYYTRIDPSRGDYIEPDYPCAGEEAIKMLYDIVSHGVLE